MVEWLEILREGALCHINNRDMNMKDAFLSATRGAMIAVLEDEELRTLAWISRPSPVLRAKLLAQFKCWQREQLRRSAKRDERSRAKATAKAKGKAKATAKAIAKAKAKKAKAKSANAKAKSAPRAEYKSAHNAKAMPKSKAKAQCKVSA